LSDFKEILIFSTDFLKGLKYHSSRKSGHCRSWGVPYGQTDGRTDGRACRSS